MGVVVFDNLPDAWDIEWAGPFAQSLAGDTNFGDVSLKRALAQPQRAAAFCKETRFRHLKYAPDFVKYCEAKYDLAIFYVADPANSLVSPPFAVWQAAGAWIGARSRHAPGSSRTDDRDDAIIFCEGDPISNLNGNRAVISMKDCLFQQVPREEWLRKISQEVYSYVSNSDGTLNEPNLRVLELASKFGLSDTDELKFSGYHQSRRPCNLRYSAFHLFDSSVTIFNVLSRLAKLVSTATTLQERLTAQICSIGNQGSTGKLSMNVGHYNDYLQVRQHVEALSHLLGAEQSVFIGWIVSKSECSPADRQRRAAAVEDLLRREALPSQQQQDALIGDFPNDTRTWHEQRDALYSLVEGIEFVVKEFEDVIKYMKLTAGAGASLHTSFLDRTNGIKVEDFFRG